jgi:hypothetical protein
VGAVAVAEVVLVVGEPGEEPVGLGHLPVRVLVLEVAPRRVAVGEEDVVAGEVRSFRVQAGQHLPEEQHVALERHLVAGGRVPAADREEVVGGAGVERVDGGERRCDQHCGKASSAELTHR